jgi:SpoVK/Ycf46/Vps4 family AAA+-type ATPase
VRGEIFAIHLRKRKRLAEKFDLDKLAEASEGYSGSEIEQAVVSALHEAYADKTGLDTDRILSALNGSPPLSVTLAEKVAYFTAYSRIGPTYIIVFHSLTQQAQNISNTQLCAFVFSPFPYNMAVNEFKGIRYEKAESTRSDGY